MSTPAVPDAGVFCLPLRTGVGLETVGALAVHADAASPDQRRFLEAFARQLALAVERARWAAEAALATLRARTEEMRASLLSAVSHDLRTPLASITGAATTLLDRTAPLPEAEREALLSSICGETERLERLVGNLLDMTRLESGGLQPKREWVPLDRGPGLSDEVELKVFEKFFRGPQAAGTSGAGLGLAICKGIVDAHGGRISVQRRSEGGSVFRVMLPSPKAPPQ